VSGEGESRITAQAGSDEESGVIVSRISGSALFICGGGLRNVVAAIGGHSLGDGGSVVEDRSHQRWWGEHAVYSKLQNRAVQVNRGSSYGSLSPFEKIWLLTKWRACLRLQSKFLRSRIE
jgi:hypothetical protein